VGVNCEKHPKVLGQAQRAKNEILNYKREKERKRKIRTPRACPTHTAPERAGAGHAR